MNQVKAFNHLLTVKELFDGLGIQFWLDGGTCLGAYRENGFMSSDFDIDVGIFGKPCGRFPEIIQGLKDKGFKLFHLKEHPCGEGKQLSCVRDGISLDIFTYWERGDNYWRLMFDFEPLRTVKYIPCVVPKACFDNLRTIDFMDYGTIFNLPHIYYLGYQYGDWKTDKSKDDFHWQTDYRCMDMDFEIFPVPKGKKRWVLVKTIKGQAKDGSFFIPHIKQGYKLYPITINTRREIVDGRRRLGAYRDLKVPMVEAFVCTTAHT